MILVIYLICSSIAIITVVLSIIIYKKAMLPEKETRNKHPLIISQKSEINSSKNNQKKVSTHYSFSKTFYTLTYEKIIEKYVYVVDAEIISKLELNSKADVIKQPRKRSRFTDYQITNHGVSMDSLLVFQVNKNQEKFDLPPISNVGVQLHPDYKLKMIGDHDA